MKSLLYYSYILAQLALIKLIAVPSNAKCAALDDGFALLGGKLKLTGRRCTEFWASIVAKDRSFSNQRGGYILFFFFFARMIRVCLHLRVWFIVPLVSGRSHVCGRHAWSHGVGGNGEGSRVYGPSAVFRPRERVLDALQL
jgi:hypothetical protein